MKKIPILLMLIFIGFTSYSAKTPYLQAQLFYAKFLAPVDGPYLETYLSVVGNSVEYKKNENGSFQGKIEVTMIFSKDGNVVNFDKYELLSPEVADTNNTNFNFLDQQRYTLPNGIYEFEIRIKDINSTAEPFKTIQTIEINFPQDEVSVSGIELLESFSKSTETTILTKSGYDCIPLVYTFFPERINNLKFYSEIYNTQKVFGEEGKFLVNYFIETSETQRRLTDFVRFKRENARLVNIILAEFEISKLPSGNYNLVVEARNTENVIIASNKVFFQRSNPNVEADYSNFSEVSTENSFVSKISNRDTLLEYIHCLAPISSDMEIKFVKYQIDKPGVDLATMQRFFLNFWLNRDELNPENAWKQYLANVELVDEQFGYPGKSNGHKGYDTDMGRVYLKYGPPNTITDRPFDASASGMSINNGGTTSVGQGTVPYQIWHYYTLNGQRDKKFVFANLHLAANDFVLIHSNVPGEITDENWQVVIKRDPKSTLMPDQDKYKNQSGDYYNNPR
jgi:GWxTD domain-containing protein